MPLGWNTLDLPSFAMQHSKQFLARGPWRYHRLVTRFRSRASRAAIAIRLWSDLPAGNGYYVCRAKRLGIDIAIIAPAATIIISRPPPGENVPRILASFGGPT